MPKGRDDWRIGTVVSVLGHVAVLLLLLTPLAITGELKEIAQGAGGPGPAGGGGGGTKALKAELIRFVKTMPAPPPTPQVQPVPPVTPPPPPTPQLEVQKLPEPALTTNTGGTGSDNTTGSGPGTGGGVGSGVGTGRGSAMGPGTGGGTQENHSPEPTELFMPPIPVPSSVKGARVLVEFDIDVTGRVLSVAFSETRDRKYNRMLEDKLREFRFRPGTKPDGTPIRMKYQMIVDLY